VNNYEVIITNDLSINGDVKASNDASFGGNLNVDGNTFIQGTTTVDGDILPQTSGNGNIGSLSKPFHSLYISSNSINFHGSSTSNATLSMNTQTGLISIQSKDGNNNNVGDPVESVTIVNEKVGINKLSSLATANLDINGTIFVSNDASFGSVLRVHDDVSLNSKLFVSSDTSMNSRLDVGNDVSMNAGLQVESYVRVGNNIVQW
jgi:predicted acyltransferase (DUF342 family)